ncbi:47526c3b-0265-4c37-8b86-90299f9b52d8 [Sclerotinia trifoliorum]|uniref:47526c3b-0265-4c37-8b86-90299f9b52d8 n=1 Tax=Sclerotinia trifoliorum TaxID=28548 RepID=A0A8H2ZTE9_9HELO|nr:47526c3b-0265-4c37-8b86-90299f9b52d8 [Sclerotinia trifoliorum]
MAFQTGFRHYVVRAAGLEFCIPTVLVEGRNYWRREFVSDYFSSRRLAVTRWINWMINDAATRARPGHPDEVPLLAEGMQVIPWRDPAPLEERIQSQVSVRPAEKAFSRHSVPFCGEVPGTLRPGLRRAIFSKACRRGVPAVFGSLEGISMSSVEGQSDSSKCEPLFSTPPSRESSVSCGILFFPELDVPYAWGSEYKRAKERFLAEAYGIDLLSV